MSNLEDQEPEGGLTPHLAIGGGRAKDAIEFYKAAFGAEEVFRLTEPQGKIGRASCRERV